jgi:hypothetical protein
LPATDASPTRHRWALLALALLSLAAALPLLLLPGDTQRYFAMSLGSPLAASFLGGCYLAGFTGLFTAWRERAWGGAAVIGPGVFTATGLALAVTLIEVGRLHLTGAGRVATAIAWGWLAAGVLAPAGWLYLVFTNDRRWATDPARRPHLPRPLLVLVVAQSALLLAVGGWLFVSPETAPWPWQLQSPADRLAGGWLVAFGLTGLAVLVERDEGRIRPAFAACLVFAGIELLAAALHLDELRFSLITIGYWAFLASLLVSGLVGFRRGVRDPRPRAAPLVR